MSDTIGEAVMAATEAGLEGSTSTSPGMASLRLQDDAVAARQRGRDSEGVLTLDHMLRHDVGEVIMIQMLKEDPREDPRDARSDRLQSIVLLSRTTKTAHQAVISNERLWQTVMEDGKYVPFEDICGEDSETYPDVDVLRWEDDEGAKISWWEMFHKYREVLGDDLISCTGFPPDTKNVHKRAIETMGGKYQGHLDRSVTVLIVGQTGTDKYKFAMHEKIPVVTEAWLYDSFKKHKRQPVEDYEPDFLLGIKICCTQLPPDLRGRIARKAQKKGAEYTPDLRKDYNTHLIAMWAEGRKFEFATRWKMKIVHPRWFYDCLTHGEFLNEEQYPVTPHQPGFPPGVALGGDEMQFLQAAMEPAGPHDQVMIMPPPGEQPVAYNGDETHEDAPEDPDLEGGDYGAAVLEGDDDHQREGGWIDPDVSTDAEQGQAGADQDAVPTGASAAPTRGPATDQ